MDMVDGRVNSVSMDMAVCVSVCEREININAKLCGGSLKRESGRRY